MPPILFKTILKDVDRARYFQQSQFAAEFWSKQLIVMIKTEGESSREGILKSQTVNHKDKDHYYHTMPYTTCHTPRQVKQNATNNPINFFG